MILFRISKDMAMINSQSLEEVGDCGRKTDGRTDGRTGVGVRVLKETSNKESYDKQPQQRKCIKLDKVNCDMWI